MMRGARLFLVLGCAPALAQPASDGPLPLYPDRGRWTQVVAAAAPELQLCIDADEPPRAVVAVLEVPPGGEAPVVRSIDPASTPCLSSALQALSFGPHHEDTMVVEVRFPLVGGTVQKPLEVNLDSRNSGPLFLYLQAAMGASERVELQRSIDDWLSDQSPPANE